MRRMYQMKKMKKKNSIDIIIYKYFNKHLINFKEFIIIKFFYYHNFFYYIKSKFKKMEKTIQYLFKNNSDLNSFFKKRLTNFSKTKEQFDSIVKRVGDK